MRSSQLGSTHLIVIGASTGGPRAVETLLAALPGTIHASIVVALHMPAAFTGPYAARLDQATAIRVAEGRDGDRLGPGDAVILPGGWQGEVGRVGEAVHLTLKAGTPKDRYAPSADHLMKSAAQALGEKSVGVILTGMGADGAAGLAAIRSADGYTIAESEDSALIYGMPAEAIRKGGAMAQLGLAEIAGALVARCGLSSLATPEDDPSAD